MGDSPGRGCGKQFCDEVEVVGSDVVAADLTHPLERLLASADEPQVDVERDVAGDRGVDATDLGEGHRSCCLVKG